MIGSREDLARYIEADRLVLRTNRRRPRFLCDETWHYLRLLRRMEYYHNCGVSVFSSPRYLVDRIRFRRLSLLLGFRIGLNSCGQGLSLPHPGTVIINSTAQIGSNCRIHVGVMIGANVVIGDRVYLGPGVKILPRVSIADGTVVGANAVVTKSFAQPGVTLAGAPARPINSNGSARFIN